MTTILTYGTFDFLHQGHLNILQNARALGDRLIVGLSTDKFNRSKGKVAHHNYRSRKAALEALPYVDLVIPESSWGQKPIDVLSYGVDIVAMGGDWHGDPRFEALKKLGARVVYFDRTPNISSTQIRTALDGGPANTATMTALKEYAGLFS